MASIRRLTFVDYLNVYLLDSPAGPVLVDSAAPGMFGWLRGALRRVGLRPEELAAVVLTHFHADHVGTARALQALGVPVYALREEIPILSGEAPHPGYGRMGGQLLRAAERLVLPESRFHGVHALEAGQELLGTGWQVLAAPGHTPGSLALFWDDTGDLISGDTLVSNFSWPRGPHPLFTADQTRAERSALALLDLEPRRIHPGHGPPLPGSAWDRVRARLRRRHRHAR